MRRVRRRVTRYAPRRALADADEPDELRLPGSLAGVKAAGSSVRWSLAAVLGRQVPQLVAALILARILGPQSYGIVSAASLYVSLTTLILDQGLAAAVVQRPSLHRDLPGAVATVNLLSAVLLAALTWLAAPAVADFFSAQDLEPLVRILGLGLVLKGLAITPRAVQQRKLAFTAIGRADISGGVLGAAAGITAALLGAGTWSMAVQVLTTDLVIAMVLLVVTRGARPHLRLRRMRSILPFSLRVFGSSALAYLSRNVDNILVGRFLGVASLSLYAMAYRVLVIPVQMIGQTVNRVTFPTFSRLAEQPDRLARALLRTLELLTFAAVPGMGLVAVAAPELVGLILGPEWSATAPLLTVLAIAGARETVCSVVGSTMRARGAGTLIFRYEWLATGTQVAGIVIGLSFGVLGVAVGLTTAGFLLMPVLLLIQRRLTGVSIGQQVGRIVGPVHAAAWGALAYLGVRLLADGVLLSLLAGAVSYALVVMVVLWLAHRVALVRAVHAARDILIPARPAPASRSASTGA
jgi:O-antigen/teichoic acid export membrane protein